jgi:hypothetical protein
MNSICLYCKGLCEAGALKCKNCGAPTLSEDEVTVDVRACPYCRRKLLALASPACNFCGLRLPDHFITRREAHLRRIMEVEDSSHKQKIKNRIDEVLRIAERHDKSGKDSMLELVNWSELTDLFS